MTQTKKAPKYFVEIITYANKISNEALNNMGLSLSWFDQSKGNAFQERLNKTNKDNQLKVQSYLKFRKISYEYAWAMFRIENISNEWGKSEILDYDVEDKVIKMESGIKKIVRKFTNEMKNKFKNIKVVVK